MAIKENIQRRLTILRSALSGMSCRHRAVILLYHRVRRAASDPQGLCCSPEHFEEHLLALKERFRLTALAELLTPERRLRVDRPSVVLTFDDGYADNLYGAKPLLEKHGVPATVFVCTGHVGTPHEPWWDELENIFLQTPVRPEALALDTAAGRRVWALGGVAPAGAAGRVRALEDDGRRLTPEEAYHEACRLLRPLAPAAIEEAMAQIRQWAQRNGSAGRMTHRMLSADEIRRLVEGGLIEIGAHTQSHALLAPLAIPEQRREIVGSRAKLEEILGRPVVFFAYPFGSLWDYSPRTVALVRQAGFLGACANFPGTVARFTDRFQLPRLLVRDWGGETLLRTLSTR